MYVPNEVNGSCKNQDVCQQTQVAFFKNYILNIFKQLKLLLFGINII